MRAIDPRKTKLSPTDDNVLVLVDNPGKTPGGILLPDVAKKGERIRFAEVLAVGDNVSEPLFEETKKGSGKGCTVLVDLDLAARVPDCPEHLLFVLPEKSILAVMS